MKMSKNFVIRMALYGGVFLYLACDLLVFKGPMRKQINRITGQDGSQVIAMRERQIVAYVFKRPIYLSQVDFEVAQKWNMMGRSPEGVSLHRLAPWRKKALDKLIDETLVRIKVKSNTKNVPIDEQRVEAAFQQFKKRFTSEQEYQDTLKALRVEGDKEMRFRVAAKMQQEAYVSEQIKEAIAVSETEAKQWYEDNKEKLTMPERVHARHIFVARLDHPEDGEERAKSALEAVKAGRKSFAAAAEEWSNDERSKKHGGDLGWMRASRLEGDFAERLFRKDFLKLGEPQLVSTKLGWHVIEVLGRKGAEYPPFELVKPEIVSTLSAKKVPMAIADYSYLLRKRHAKRVEVLEEVLEMPWSLPKKSVEATTSK